MLGKKKQKSLRYLVLNKSFTAVMSSAFLRIICIYAFAGEQVPLFYLSLSYFLNCTGILVSHRASKTWIAITILISTALSLRYAK